MYTSGTSKLGLSRILSSPFTEGALLVPELPSKVCSVLPSVVSLLGTTTCSYCLVPHIVHAMYLPSNCGSWGFSRRLGTSSPRCHTFRNVVFPSDFSNSLYQVSILWVKNLWDIRGFLSRSLKILAIVSSKSAVQCVTLGWCTPPRRIGVAWKSLNYEPRSL